LWPQKGSFPGVFHQTQPPVEQTHDAGVHDPVEYVVPVAPRSDHTLIYKTLKLVGYGLGLHLERIREVRNADLTGFSQGMKHPQAGLVPQDFKKRFQFG